MLWFVRNFNFGIEEKGKYQYKITTDKENLLDLKCSELIFFQSPVSEGLVKAQNFRSHVVNCFHEIILPFTWRPHIYLVMFTVCWELLLVVIIMNILLTNFTQYLGNGSSKQFQIWHRCAKWVLTIIQNVLTLSLLWFFDYLEETKSGLTTSIFGEKGSLVLIFLSEIEIYFSNWGKQTSHSYLSANVFFFTFLSGYVEIKMKCN